jgi:hypothetical protein
MKLILAPQALGIEFEPKGYDQWCKLGTYFGDVDSSPGGGGAGRSGVRIVVSSAYTGELR